MADTRGKDGKPYEERAGLLGKHIQSVVVPVAVVVVAVFDVVAQLYIRTPLLFIETVKFKVRVRVREG